jgi:hypothetical protein
MGLLVYYFKKRIVEVEQKNATCLEIVQDVYTQHMKLRNEMYSIMMSSQGPQQEPHHQHQPKHQHQHYYEDEQRDDRIKIVLSDEDEVDSEEDEVDSEEDEVDSEVDSEDESESDEESIKRDINDIDYDDLKQEDDSDKKIKVVSVDLTFNEEVEINVDDEDLDEIDGETELKSLQPIEAPIVVNKVEAPPITKEELKKLTPSALKSLLTGKGVPADQVSKMKKNELIEKLLQDSV